MNGKNFRVEHPGMSEDILDFDTSSLTIYATYITFIFTYFNSSSPSGSGGSTTNTTKVKANNFISKSNKLTNKSPGENGFPSGKRSYSSIPIGKINKEQLFMLRVPVKNRETVNLYFDSLDSLNDYVSSLQVKVSNDYS